MRAVQMAAHLASDHALTLLAPRPEGGDAAAPAPADLPYRVETYRVSRGAAAAGVARAAVSGQPLQSGLFRQPELARKLRALAPRADLVILQLSRLTPHVDDLGDTPFAVDLIDSLALNMERRALYDRPPLRPVLKLEAGRLLAAETGLARRAAATLLVCERDRAWLAERLAPEAAAKLHVVPLEMTAGGSTAEDLSAEKRAADPGAVPRLVFTGNLGYFVNVDAAVSWLAEVWPQLDRRWPELRVTLAGARPAPRVSRAVKGAEGVELIDSPPQMASVLAGATAALAPLRAGSGVPVKVLEAWAAGVPVIASRWAAAGAGARPGLDLLVAETPQEWSDAVARLLADAGLVRRLAEAGRARLAAEHSPAAVASALERALSRALKQPPPPASEPVPATEP
jgi:glycosyltransferase involved in cell wall biosynthesis